MFLSPRRKSPGLRGLCGSLTENDTACHKKQRISNGNTDFLVFLFMSLFFYFSFTPLLLCYFVFEHVSGCALLSDWNRCCAWIVVALFWCDCITVYVQVHSAVVVKVSLLPLRFLLLVIGTKRAEVVSSPPCLFVSVEGPSSRLWIVPCVGLDMPA